jgi:serine/threonine protein kinase
MRGLVNQGAPRRPRLAAGFEHEGLPRVLGFERKGERSFLAMERLRGGTLGERVVAGTRVQGPAFEELLRRLLEAVGYLHERSFIHGDVTPRNVMFRTARDSRPVLIDLDGLCSPHEHGLPSLVMTPGYTAPEQKAGEVSIHSDLYGVGATMIYAATGRSPDQFLRNGDVEVELPGISAQARALVQRLVDLDPKRRPKNARAALRMLDRGGRQLRRFAATMLAAAVIVAVFISLAVATHASTMR